MTEPFRSIADIAEHLMREFESVFPSSTISETVLRISCNGAVSLPVLADLSHRELAQMAAGIAAPQGIAPTA